MIKAVPIPLENGLTGWVHAGPTREMPPGYELVRCAIEIPVAGKTVAYDIAIPDFSTFQTQHLDEVLPELLDDLAEGRKLYIGCMGGTGRTGTLLALLVAQHPAFTGEMAVAYIRQVYKPGAVETEDQKLQVEGYLAPIRVPVFSHDWLDDEPPTEERDPIPFPKGSDKPRPAPWFLRMLFGSKSG